MACGEKYSSRPFKLRYDHATLDENQVDGEDGGAVKCLQKPEEAGKEQEFWRK